jgi:hypothetical protein
MLNLILLVMFLSTISLKESLQGAFLIHSSCVCMCDKKHPCILVPEHLDCHMFLSVHAHTWPYGIYYRTRWVVCLLSMGLKILQCISIQCCLCCSLHDCGFFCSTPYVQESAWKLNTKDIHRAKPFSASLATKMYIENDLKSTMTKLVAMANKECQILKH